MLFLSRQAPPLPPDIAAQACCPSTTVDCAISASVGTVDHGFSLNAQFHASTCRVALFGPSGSGKSLTLMAMAGLLPPARGRISIRGTTFLDTDRGINIPARKRRVGFLFQDYALFPHLTVRGNVSFGLKPVFGPIRPAQKQRVEELLELCGLQDLASQRPAQLSGGQRQRAALARALATEPDLLLLDEPFTALDQPLRQRMREEVSRILDRFNIPMILVSHDLDDIDYFAQTLVAFGHGRVLDVVDYESRRKTESPTQILDPLFEAAHR